MSYYDHAVLMSYRMPPWNETGGITDGISPGAGRPADIRIFHPITRAFKILAGVAGAMGPRFSVPLPLSSGSRPASSGSLTE